MDMSRTLALGAACLLVGCADFRAYCDAQLIASRNSYLARTAWHERGGALCEGRNHQGDFQDGFYEGYLGVASGMGGVAPLVPPEKYWAACYQDVDGHEMINAWFAGYNEGAFAAAQDGIGELAEIPSWLNGGCCDENGRLLARPEPPPGPRKPRRGDPPIRATLPPPLPDADKPLNSEGNADLPADPNKVETPPPSEPESNDAMPLDPDGLEMKGVPNEKTAPKNDAKKIKTASRTTRSKIVEPRRESKTDADRWAKSAPVKRAPPKKSTVEKSMPWTPASTPISRVAPSTPAELGESLPVNPFARPKASRTPAYPVAPPVLPSVELKSSTMIERETPKPSRTVEPNEFEPPPPPRAMFKSPETSPIAAAETASPKPSADPPLVRPTIEKASHTETMKANESAKPVASPAPTEVKPVDPPPVSKDVEDGWGTPHDNRAADLAGRKNR
jgi:hypothetical protein